MPEYLLFTVKWIEAILISTQINATSAYMWNGLGVAIRKVI
jgi:hypothetical protein